MTANRLQMAVVALALCAAPAAAHAAEKAVPIRIVNQTPYPLFVETLGAGLVCIKEAINPVSVKPGEYQGAQYVWDQACRYPAGQNTFVIGTPKGEQRLNVPFSFAPGQMAGPTHSSALRVLPGGLNGGMEYIVSCYASCGQGGVALTLQNDTGSPLMVASATPDCAGQAAAPPKGRGVIDVSNCDRGTFAVTNQGRLVTQVELAFGPDGRVGGQALPNENTTFLFRQPVQQGNGLTLTVTCPSVDCSGPAIAPVR